MIEEIKKLRRKGLSYRKIAIELDTTIGKVQYQWKKYQKLAEKDKVKESSSTDKKKRTGSTLKSVQARILNKRKLIPAEHLTAWLIDKNKLFVFWKLLDVKQELLENYFSQSVQSKQKVLRVYDVTHIIFDGNNAHQIQEYNLTEGQEISILNDLQPNRCYITELGIKIKENEFFPLLRSNTVHMPRTSKKQTGHFKKEIDLYLRKSDSMPKWVEHVSTYSYYENTIKG